MSLCGSLNKCEIVFERDEALPSGVNYWKGPCEIYWRDLAVTIRVKQLEFLRREQSFIDGDKTVPVRVKLVQHSDAFQPELNRRGFSFALSQGLIAPWMLALRMLSAEH